METSTSKHLKKKKNSFSHLFFFKNKSARVCITLWGQSKKGTTFPIGWVAVNLVNFKGIFMNSSMLLRLWRDEVANPIGICGEKLNPSPDFDVLIRIEFTTFMRQLPKKVIFQLPFENNGKLEFFFKITSTFENFF